MTLALASALAWTAQDADPLAKYGLKPTLHVVAVDGRAAIAEGETVELIGVTDIASAESLVRTVSGRLVDAATEATFWSILDTRPPDDLSRTTVGGEGSKQLVRRLFGKDPDGRTIALAFKLSPTLTTALDPYEDAKKFEYQISATRPAVGSGSDAYVGVARLLKPVLPKDSTDTTFDLRLEVPGGEWSKIAEFPFGEDTTLADGTIGVKMRWQSYSDFRMVDGHQEIVDYKGYFFTVTLPEALRAMELAIVTNDPAEDAKRLPPVVTQHFRGETQGEGFQGKDLFLVYGLTSRSQDRVFTLRARPRRIVEFRGIPFKRE